MVLFLVRMVGPVHCSFASEPIEFFPSVYPSIIADFYGSRTPQRSLATRAPHLLQVLNRVIVDYNHPIQPTWLKIGRRLTWSESSKPT